MTDIRRALLWGVFSVSLLMLWDAWNKHTGQPSLFDPPRPAATAPTAAPAAGPGAATGSVPAAASASATAAGAVAAVPSAAGASPPAGETVTVTTDLVRATLDSRGGSLVRLELLKHAEQDDPARNVVLFDRTGARQYLAESGLIPAQDAQVLPNHTTQMTLAPGARELAAGQDTLDVVFESPPVSDVTLRKTYRFKRGAYPIAVTHQIVNNGSAPVTPRLYLQLVRDGAVPPASIFMAPVSYTGPAAYTEAAKFVKLDFDSIAKQKAEPPARADNGWISMVQHYFASAWLLPDALAREFQVRREANGALYAISMIAQLPAVAPGATAAQTATLFAGPQEENKLAALAPGLELVKDYGVLTMLAKPLFWLLDKLHAALGNWGWAIVALVVLLKIAFYWLNASAYRSMAKMKAVNPRVMELRERYKDEPQKMQQEMMRIYREEKVNPLGGCLPIVVQMPFFIALYWVLLSSVEMRNAPWIGWIKDLSAIDPYYILPLLMTGSTVLQTWLSPTPTDPVQAKMMWIMPLVFSVFFFFFPAGLVLYWLTNNLLSIAQQWFINRQLGVA
jgi:YidC/Oxa1 family membrane protein insertase